MHDLPPLADDLYLAAVPVTNGFKRLGHCELHAFIGEGGQGVVYRGRHVELDKQVAVKILKPEWAKDAKFVHRFKREARTAARLDRHPNLIQIYDLDFRYGIHFIEMELVDGLSARELVRREGPLGLERALRIVRDCAKGLSFAHRHGIVHRDVKPENIMIDNEDGAVKVADLGLAKPTESSTDLTRSSIVGTPGYMSPEQWHDSRVGASSDVFSLGCTWYFLMTGEDAYRGSWMEKMNAVCNDRFPRIQDKIDGAPRMLCDILDRCTRKRPGDRFADAAELGRALDKLARVIGVSETPGPAGSEESTVPIRKQEDAWDGIWKVAKAPVLVLLVTGVILLLTRVTRDLMKTTHDEAATPVPLNTRLQLRTNPEAATYVLTAMTKDLDPVVGQTPATCDVPNGDWMLHLESPWHVPWDSSLALRGDSLDLSVSLSSFGSARITSDPIGASIRYRRDASSAWRAHPAVTPATIDVLEAGEWMIRLSRTDFEPLSGTIVVSERQLTEFAYTLVPADTIPPAPATTDSVSYCVSVSPGAARVHVDGKLQPGFEQDGFVFLTLPEGDHRFRVQNPMAPTVDLFYEVVAGDPNRSLILDFEARRIKASTSTGLCDSFDH